MQQAPDNPHGLTQWAWWDDSFSANPPLREQLAQAGAQYREIEIPYIIGMGGAAFLVIYTSPNAGEAVTVFCAPSRYEIDAYAESYYYFPGLDEAEAIARDWSVIYDFTRTLTR